MRLDLATHRTLAEVRQFLEALAPSRAEAYAHVERTVRRFSYWKLHKRAERGLLRTYLQRTTGLSRAQVARLIAAYIAESKLADGRKGAARPFRRRYTRDDILLLAETDALHGTLSGPGTSFAELDREAHTQTDHAAAREALFAELREAA